MSAKPQPGRVAGHDDWLEILPMAALVVDAGTHIRFANSAAQPLAGGLHGTTLKQLLGELHPLVRAIAEARTARLDDMPWPRELGANAPVAVWVMPLAAGDALVLLDVAYAKDAASYTRLSSTMAAMLAHEIRNPLLAIKGASQLLGQNTSKEDAPLTELIVKEVNRIDQLIATLDPLSDAPPRTMAALNIHEPLEHARQATEAAFPAPLTFVADYDPSLPSVTGEKDALVQLFLNLLKNAAEAVAQTEDPTITLTSRYALGETRRNAAGIALPVAISISDNGPGIAPEVAGELFAPFTTTKPGGRGLGLAVVARIVEEHGGQMAVDAPVAGGARLTLYLPTA